MLLMNIESNILIESNCVFCQNTCIQPLRIQDTILICSFWFERRSVYYCRKTSICALNVASNSFSVVIQQYEAEADNEYVIRGNSAIMKCEIPSYVSDFIVVDMWADSDGGSYYPNNDQYGTV